jgi:hypothetical protein
VDETTGPESRRAAYMPEREFSIVSDELRKLPRHHHGGRPTPEWLERLREGRTIFLPGATHKVTGAYAYTLRKQGYRLHARLTVQDGVAGVVLWVERDR